MMGQRPTSFRLTADLVQALQRQARESGLSLTALAQRYLHEGLRRADHPLIVFRDGAGGRRPALAGTRLDVWQVVETAKEAGSVREAAEYLSIPEPWVQAAVRYYAEYRDEVDEWAERMHAAAERDEAAWRREQAVLA